MNVSIHQHPLTQLSLSDTFGDWTAGANYKLRLKNKAFLCAKVTGSHLDQAGGPGLISTIFKSCRELQARPLRAATTAGTVASQWPDPVRRS